MLPPQWEIDSIFFMHELRLALWWTWVNEHIGRDILELLSPSFNRSGSFCFLRLNTATTLGGTQTTQRGCMRPILRLSSTIPAEYPVNNQNQLPTKLSELPCEFQQASPPNGHHLNWYHLEWKSLPAQFSQTTESSDSKKTKNKKQVCGFKTLSVKVVSFMVIWAYVIMVEIPFPVKISLTGT